MPSSPSRAVSVGPPSGDDELRALTDLLNRTYNRSEEDGQSYLKRVPHEDIRVVRSGSEVAGSLHLVEMGQWLGAACVPMTGVSAVGVAPEHRGTSLGTLFMQRVLAELHSRGVPLSALYPATVPVYRRPGYELAGLWLRYRLGCEDIDVRDRDLPLRRIESPEEELETLKRVYTRRARRTQGNLDRGPRWRGLVGTHGDAPHAYTVGRPGAEEGYVLFDQQREGGWKYELRCRDLVALTPAAARRLLTFFADHRSFATAVVWTGGPADPLRYLLREQAWDLQRHFAWMLRIVDVRGALAARGYPLGVEAEVHLEVSDDVLPWNHGRFVLEVSGGKAKARKGGRGRVKVDVRGLAPLYTGHMAPRELLATGLLDAADRDLDTCAPVFAAPAPWMADFF